MTRTKLIQIAKLALRHHAGEPLDRQAAGLADAIELALQMEVLEEAETTTAPQPTVAVVQPIAPEEPFDFKSLLPISPAVSAVSPDTPQESRRDPATQNPGLVIMPDSREAVTVMQEAKRPDPGVVTPISVPRIRETEPEMAIRPNERAGPPGDPVYWRVEDISRVLHEKTPETIKVVVEHPERGQIPIKLERNIVVGAGFDVVKLIYKHPAADDHLAVAETFANTQRELPIGAAMEKIQINAQKAYSPRQRYITSKTPIRTGPMTFSLDAPHDEVVIDLTNPNR